MESVSHSVQFLWVDHISIKPLKEQEQILSVWLGIKLRRGGSVEPRPDTDKELNLKWK